MERGSDTGSDLVDIGYTGDDTVDRVDKRKNIGDTGVDLVDTGYTREDTGDTGVEEWIEAIQAIIQG